MLGELPVAEKSVELFESVTFQGGKTLVLSNEGFFSEQEPTGINA